MKFAPATDYTSNSEDRSNQGLVCVVHDVSEKAWLAMRELQNKFFLTFEESLYMCPIGGVHTTNEVHFITFCRDVGELKAYEAYIQAWVDGYQANT